jgi:hypothetical protein
MDRQGNYLMNKLLTTSLYEELGESEVGQFGGYSPRAKNSRIFCLQIFVDFFVFST